jgi:hypothetical protein
MKCFCACSSKLHGQLKISDVKPVLYFDPENGGSQLLRNVVTSCRITKQFQSMEGRSPDKCKGEGHLRTGHNAKRGSRGVAALYNLGARCGWVVPCHVPAALSLDRPGTNFRGGWVGPRDCLDWYGKSRPHRDSIPRTVQAVASPYTD